jgi:hypothetical protein
MTALQLGSFAIQVMQVVPDMQHLGEWYIGAWERVRAVFVRNRELNTRWYTPRVQSARR